MPSTTSSQPRIITVDSLRGFALLGILAAHFIYWYSGGELPQSVYEKFNDAGSIIAASFSGIFITGKFFTFFSFLFGLSFYLQMQSLQKKDENFVVRYLWRLIILGIIGLIHHALWRGDILSIYVPLGFVLLLARNISDRLLLILALLLLFNIPVRIIDIINYFIHTPQVSAVPVLPVSDGAARYYDVIKQGTFGAMIRDNWKALAAKFDFQFSSGRIYITLGFFMSGTYVGRKKWFENPSISKPIIKRLCKNSGWVSVGIILFSITLFTLNATLKWGIENNRYVQFVFSLLYDTANASLTVFYLSGLTLLMYRLRWQKVLYPLAPVGKMALTVYLSQTFFGLLLFYHFGLGLFEKTSPGINLLLIIPVFAIQVYVCRLWLKFFHYGPVEWLWRSLTFFKWYPFIKKNNIEILE